VVEKVALEFCRCDLEAADFHDLLEAVNNENVVIDIDDSFIACADPSKTYPISPPPRVDNAITYPSKKVSDVLEAANELPSSYVRALGGKTTHACSLLIYLSAFDGL
jgi:hypothetical protein